MIQPGDKIRVLAKYLSGAQVDVGDVLTVTRVGYPITNQFGAYSIIGPYANIEWSLCWRIWVKVSWLCHKVYLIQKANA